MREQIIRNRKNILITIAILLSLAFNLGMRYLATRPRYKTLPEVRLVNQKEESTKGFAIMIPNENGDGYVEYSKDTWPSAEEGYEFKEAKCMDNNGRLIDDVITFKDGKASLKINKEVYCTMYFDNKPKMIKILREKDTQKYLSEDTPGGMYRYQAAPTSTSDAVNMTNWICFGTYSKEECTNTTDSDNNGIPDGIDKYMYRIIGITSDGQLYLIKETFLKENNNVGFAWNTAYLINSGSGVDYCTGGVCPEWNEADLFKRINGIANGSISGNGNGIHSNTDIFVDSKEYDYLKSGDGVNGTGTASEWYSLILDHEWMYGDTNITDNSIIYNGDKMYAIETGAEGGETTHYVGEYGKVQSETYRWPSKNKVSAKISLMYMHDYAYSYYDGSDQATRGFPASNSIAKNSWLFFQKDGFNRMLNYEWFSTRWGENTSSIGNVNARTVNNYGSSDIGIYTRDAYGARPVFYLSSNAKIMDGEGTKAKPYVLSPN